MKAMNKGMTFLAAVSLAIFSMGATAAADTLPPDESNQEDQVNEDEQTNEDEPLQLSLDEVVEKVLENDNNLVIMKAEYAKLKSQTSNLQKDFRDLEDALDDLWDERENLSGPDRIPNSEAIRTHNDLIKDLEDTLLQLENSLAISEISEEQLKTSLRFQTESRYVSLLTAQEQIEFAKQTISKLEKDLQAAQLRHQYGAASKVDIEDIERELHNAKTNFEQQEEDYRADVKKLLLDMNVPYETTIELASVTPDEIKPVEKPEDITPFIESSYAMQQAEKALELANELLENVDSYDRRGKEQAEQDVLIKEEEIKKLESDLEREIDTLYHNINTAYRNVTEAETNLENAKTDYERMKISYELGILSKHDYENGQLLVDQAELELTLSKMNYFVLQKQLEAMKNGLVQVSASAGGM